MFILKQNIFNIYYSNKSRCFEDNHICMYFSKWMITNDKIYYIFIKMTRFMGLCNRILHSNLYYRKNHVVQIIFIVLAQNL